MSNVSFHQTITLAITGASGAPYAMALLEVLLKANCRIYLLISDAACVVFQQELGLQIPNELQARQAWFLNRFQTSSEQLQLFSKNDWFAPVASGSAYIDAMVICPTSGGTLSAVAQGASNNLIERAADVMLKEKRPLILVPRETPVSEIHLENMLKLARMGAHILPASPGFYHKPQSVNDLVLFVVARIMKVLGLPQEFVQAWGQA